MTGTATRQPPFELCDVNVMVGRYATGQGAADCEELQTRMDRLGVAAAVVTHTYAWRHDVAYGNRMIAEQTARHPRLHQCWVLLPDSCGEVPPPEAMLDAAHRAGVAAFRAYPHDHGYDLLGPDPGKLLAGLEEYGRPLLIDLDQTSWTRIDTLAERHPALPLVVAGTGYRTVRPMAGVLERRPNVYVDLSYLGTHQILEWLVERFGDSRVLFGTGFPLRDPADAVTRLLWSGLDDTSAAAIGGATLLRLLERDSS